MEIIAIGNIIPDSREFDLYPDCSHDITTLQKSASQYDKNNKEEKINNIEVIKVTIHPNPANNTVFISLDKIPETSIHYQLYDIEGKELQSGNFSNQKQELDISSLSKGLYFISVNVETQSKITKKVVKE